MLPFNTFLALLTNLSPQSTSTSLFKAGAAQLINNRQPAKPEVYSGWIFLRMKYAVRVPGPKERMEEMKPKPEEISDIDVEFISFRRQKSCHYRKQQHDNADMEMKTHSKGPQNVIRLSCTCNATSSIFFQTPDLKATQLHSALTAALMRGFKCSERSMRDSIINKNLYAAR